jgi:hypothetical protein
MVSEVMVDKKIDTLTCKYMIYFAVQEHRRASGHCVYDELGRFGTNIWKRSTKTTLAKLKNHPCKDPDAHLKMFADLGQKNEGWCCHTSAKIDDPKIIIREFEPVDGDYERNRLISVVIATDPTDKQYLGIGWIFDCAP